MRVERSFYCDSLERSFYLISLEQGSSKSRASLHKMQSETHFELDLTPTQLLSTTTQTAHILTLRFANINTKPKKQLFELKYAMPMTAFPSILTSNIESVAFLTTDIGV